MEHEAREIEDMAIANLCVRIMREINNAGYKKAERVYALCESIAMVIDIHNAHDYEFAREALAECLYRKLDEEIEVKKVVIKHILSQESWPQH